MPQPTPDVSHLIAGLDAAVQSDSTKDICRAVKHALVDTIKAEGFELPERFVRPEADKYARHLLHKCDDYVVVVMVWGAGQGTPIHDHDEKWCVECVYRGSITVKSYDLVETADPEVVEFRKADEVVAGRGMAGALIPPFDYHVIENQTEELAATIHVYGGEMHACHTFAPIADGRYRRERRELSYSA